MRIPIYFQVSADKRLINAPDFNRSTHEISALYEKNLNYVVKGVEKFLIKLKLADDYRFSPPSEMFPIVILSRKYDFAAYWARNEQERKVEILEIIYESVTDMCQKLNLDISPFTTAYQTLKKMSY